MSKISMLVVFGLLVANVILLPMGAMGATYDADITSVTKYANRYEVGDTQLIKVYVQNTGTSDPYDGFASFVVKAKVYVDGSLFLSKEGTIVDIYYNTIDSIGWEFTLTKPGKYTYYAEVWNTPKNTCYDTWGPNTGYDVTGKGDLRVKSYNSDGSSLTADTIVIYDSSGKEVNRRYNDNDYTFEDLTTGKYGVEIYEMNMFVDGAYNQEVTHGSTKTVYLYANSLKTLTIKTTFDDGTVFEGASVKLYSWDGYNDEWDFESSKTTDNAGKTSFEVYPTTASGEKYRIDVLNSNGNYVGGNSNVQLTSSTTKTILTNQAPPPGSLRVKCYDSNSISLTAETIIIYDSNYQEKQRKYSSNDYTFTDLSSGTYITEIYDMNMLVDSEANLQVTSGNVRTVSMYANAKVTLTVDVTYNDGVTDFSGASVKLFSWDGYNGVWDGESNKDTDGQGRVQFSVYPTTANGEKYWVDVVHNGYLVASNDNVRLSSNKVITLTTTVQVPPGSIRVKTFDENEASMVAETILLFDSSWNELGRVYNDNDHTFTGLSVGNYIVQSYDMNMLVSQASNVKVEPAKTTDVNLKANPKVTLTVTVLYNDGSTRHTHATVSVYSRDGYEDTWDHEGTMDCDVNGQVSFNVYPTNYPGEKYRLVALNGQDIIGKDENVVLTKSTIKTMKTDEYPPLVAEITGPTQTEYILSKEKGTASVEFTAQVSGGQGTKEISWSFGDGGTASGNPANHIYAKPGTWDVTMTVTDEGGRKVETSMIIKTFAYNDGIPIITLESPADGTFIGDLDTIIFTWTPFPNFYGTMSYDVFLDASEAPTTRIATVTTTSYDASGDVLAVIGEFQDDVQTGNIETLPPLLHWTVVPSNDMGEGICENGPFALSLIDHSEEDERNFVEDLIDSVEVQLNIGKYMPYFGVVREVDDGFYVGVTIADIGLTGTVLVLGVPCAYEIGVSGSIEVLLSQTEDPVISGSITLEAYFGPGISTPSTATAFSLKLAIMFGIKVAVSVDPVPLNESLKLNFDAALSVKLCLFLVETTFDHDFYHAETEKAISEFLPEESNTPLLGEEIGDDDTETDEGNGDVAVTESVNNVNPGNDEPISIGNSDRTASDENGPKDTGGSDENIDVSGQDQSEVDPMDTKDNSNYISDGSKMTQSDIDRSPSDHSTKGDVDDTRNDLDRTSEIWSLASGAAGVVNSSSSVPYLVAALSLAIIGLIVVILRKEKGRRKNVALIRAQRRGPKHRRNGNDKKGRRSRDTIRRPKTIPGKPRRPETPISKKTVLSKTVLPIRCTSSIRRTRLTSKNASIDLPIEDLGENEVLMCGAAREVDIKTRAMVPEPNLKIQTSECELDGTPWYLDDEIIGPTINPTGRTLVVTI